jgi:hypothetical protein
MYIYICMYMYVCDMCISNMSIICIFNNEIDATDIECTYVYSMCVWHMCVEYVYECINGKS